jgi:hypothetical protein
LAAAGLTVALAVVLTGGDPRDPWPGTDAEPGAVVLAPTLIEPDRSAAASSTGSPVDPAVGSDRVAERPVGGGTPTSGATGRLGVSLGSVGGLYPGHRVALGVRYVNPYSFPIAIDRVSVQASGTERCTARQLMPTATHRVRLPSRSSVASTIDVGMRRSAPDACQGVRFAVRVQVTAVKL